MQESLMMTNKDLSDIWALEKKNVIIHVALTRNRRGERTFEQAMMDAVCALAEVNDRLIKHLTQIYEQHPHQLFPEGLTLEQNERALHEQELEAEELYEYQMRTKL